MSMALTTNLIPKDPKDFVVLTFVNLDGMDRNELFESSFSHSSYHYFHREIDISTQQEILYNQVLCLLQDELLSSLLLF
jgi:hypothetical protein